MAYLDASRDNWHVLHRIWEVQYLHKLSILSN